MMLSLTAQKPPSILSLIGDIALKDGEPSR